MKIQTRAALILLSALILSAAAPAPVQPEAQLPDPAAVLAEPRDQDEHIHTEKLGAVPMTATEKKAYDVANAKPTEALLNSYITGDYRTGTVYTQHNADQPVGLASTTKLMTVFVAMDAADRGEISLKDPVTIDDAVASMHGSTYKMKAGEVYTVEELIHAGMIVSGNDAMVALSKHVAGSEEAFVSRMNQKAKELCLTHAHFINCHGLTDYEKNDYNRATAREMFQLSRELLKKYPTILDATRRVKLEEPDREFRAYNTNPILGIVDGIDGLKTGYTGIAGRCFIATGVEKAMGRNLENRFIAVCMGARNDMDRYVAARRLSEDAMERHHLRVLSYKGEEVAELVLENASPRRSPVYAKDEITRLVANDEIKRMIDYYDIDIPHKKEAPVGRMRFIRGGKEIARTDLFVKEDIKKPNPILRYRDMMTEIFIAIEKAS
ncbi:D-alanyl-D-alanine carboxypeptidase dacA precursor [Aedoeadaptatus ivorii]|uniref:serine-type D-Ala-D-Ala carboxypeptidase n=1 Tax=Aedoeadaptatus ivorii TaxID=54006 RepID=A0A3S4ZPX0_9FIRM|nr:D-alanyl-D-alanine carboxypeptidase family protein [Peptoniphilus ivorii]VEJ34787.1 D-alanyl-D-alanine carboxypeptidase dacA precursor [Peptoniphilus ivorii]